MAHFAEIKDGKVARVTVGNDDGGYEWLIENLGGVWVQTSYNTFGGVHYTTDDEGNRVPSDDQSKALRFNYAGIGFTYDEARDAFIPPTPYPSWVLDEGTCLWVAPIPMPEEVDADGEPIPYRWDEEAGDWVAADV